MLWLTRQPRIWRHLFLSIYRFIIIVLWEGTGQRIHSFCIIYLTPPIRYLGYDLVPMLFIVFVSVIHNWFWNKQPTITSMATGSFVLVLLCTSFAHRFTETELTEWLNFNVPLHNLVIWAVKYIGQAWYRKGIQTPDNFSHITQY